ncbi:MAG: tRNA pseudouridine(55) synthase TruB [Trueperaceae bacterium]|nr:tRNA pseudouridine(55) synthase TruB [Trueperaceae bacterium]
MPAFVVDKPLGLTSHDVVARARRALGTRRVGHGGTLDPLATGVLVVLAEEATKLSPFLTGSDKAYLAWVAFGVGTPTLDAEGPVDARADAAHVEQGAVAAALPPFLDLTLQAPPAYSAVKRGGVKGYEAARRGEALDLPPRPAGYREVRLLAFGAVGDLPTDVGPMGAAPQGAAPLPPFLDPAAPAALIALTVRGGTYVRAFARDLGAALGVPAHLAGLRRTRAGAADLGAAVALEGLAEAAPVDPVALLGLPVVALDEDAARRVRDGRRDPASFDGRAALVDAHGALVAVADAVDGRCVPVRVWRSPV